jgi:hypothetical protein
MALTLLISRLTLEAGGLHVAATRAINFLASPSERAGTFRASLAWAFHTAAHHQIIKRKRFI